MSALRNDLAARVPAANNDRTFRTPPALQKVAGRVQVGPKNAADMPQVAALEKASRQPLSVSEIFQHLQELWRLMRFDPSKQPMADAEVSRTIALEKRLLGKLISTRSTGLSDIVLKMRVVVEGKDLPDALEARLRVRALRELREARISAPPAAGENGRVDSLHLSTPDTALSDLAARHIANLRAFNTSDEINGADGPLWAAYEATRDAISAAKPASLDDMLAKARAAKAEATDSKGRERPEGSMAANWAWDLLNDLLRLARQPDAKLRSGPVASAQACPASAIADQLDAAFAAERHAERHAGKSTRNLNQALAFERIETLMKLASVTQATSLRGAAAQVLAAADYASNLLAFDGMDQDEAAEAILRLMFSASRILQEDPRAALPPDLVDAVLGEHRNPFLTNLEQEEVERAAGTDRALDTASQAGESL